MHVGLQAGVGRPLYSGDSIKKIRCTLRVDKAGILREQLPLSITVTSSPTRRIACHALRPLPDWSAGCLLLLYSAARLFVCRVVLQIPRARHARVVAGSVRENVRNNSKNVKSHVFLYVKFHRYAQLSEVNTSKSPTSNIVLRSVDTGHKKMQLRTVCDKSL